MTLASDSVRARDAGSRGPQAPAVRTTQDRMDAARVGLHELLRELPVGQSQKDAICRRMSEEYRAYHGVDHLVTLWARHRLYAAAAGLDDARVHTLLACAIAYHDLVYVPGRADNEDRSADLWMADSATSGLDLAERSWVADTVRATADHLGYEPRGLDAAGNLSLLERARLWMLDLDLTPIGEAAEVFIANTDALRREGGRADPAAFERSRLAFLRHLAAHPRLYRSPVLAAAFETQARRNIARELAGLRAERAGSRYAFDARGAHGPGGGGDVRSR